MFINIKCRIIITISFSTAKERHNPAMKHCFIVNPAAGKGNKYEALLEDIHRVCHDERVDYDIHVTTAVSDATAYVRSVCESAGDSPVRFYACGGDGTISEVLNGVVGHENAEIGHIPVGTGNDFARLFSHGEYFFDIRRQIGGESAAVDVMRYTCGASGKHAGYGINMFNVGFDCAVVCEVARIKRSPAVAPGFAYIGGVLRVLTRMPYTKMYIEADGGKEADREMLLCAVGNGCYCGGGFKALPAASVNDGMLDACLVEKMTRAQFLGLVGAYKNGTHVTNKKCSRFITYRKFRKMDIRFEEPTDICVDGEIERTDRITVECVPSAVRFVCPEGSELIYTRKNEDAVKVAAIQNT